MMDPTSSEKDVPLLAGLALAWGIVDVIVCGIIARDGVMFTAVVLIVVIDVTDIRSPRGDVDRQPVGVRLVRRKTPSVVATA